MSLAALKKKTRSTIKAIVPGFKKELTSHIHKQQIQIITIL